MATDTQNYDTMSPIEKLIMAAQIISPPLDTPTIKVISVQNSPINLSLKDQQTVNSGSKSPVTTPEKPLFYWKHKNKYLAQKEPLPILNKSKLEDNNVAKILPLDRKTCEISLQEKSVPQITNIRLLTTIYGIEQPNIETSKKYLSLNPDIFSLHGQDSPTFSSLKTSGKVINIPQTLKPTNESYSRVKSLRWFSINMLQHSSVKHVFEDFSAHQCSEPQRLQLHFAHNIDIKEFCKLLCGYSMYSNLKEKYCKQIVKDKEPYLLKS